MRRFTGSIGILLLTLAVLFVPALAQATTPATATTNLSYNIAESLTISAPATLTLTTSFQDSTFSGTYSLAAGHVNGLNVEAYFANPAAALTVNGGPNVPSSSLTIWLTNFSITGTCSQTGGFAGDAGGECFWWQANNTTIGATPSGGIGASATSGNNPISGSGSFSQPFRYRISTAPTFPGNYTGVLNFVAYVP